MRHALALLTLSACLIASSAAAQDKMGTASGRGVIDRFTGWDKQKDEPIVEKVSFSPRYSYAHGETVGKLKFSWIVLTEKEPPASLLAAKDRAEARRLWCEKEKASFVAVRLDAEGKPDVLLLCPANGKVNTEMLSTWNGLESFVVTFQSRDAKRLKGTLVGGDGSCPDDKGGAVYCTPQEDYAFDAPFFH